MALAEFKLVQCTGTNAATETDVAENNSGYRAVDAATPPANNPIKVPDSGSERSFEVWFRLECVIAPNNYCQNFKVWGPATQPDSPTGELTVYIGASATGVTPTDSVSTIATAVQHTNHYEEANALVFDSDAQKIQDVGDKTDYIVLQLDAQPSAATGNMLTQLLSFTYEEG